MKNRIGVVSCHFKTLESIEDLFERVSQYGIKEIEWFDCTWFEEQYGKDIFKKICKLSESKGIESSYHAPWSGKWDLSQNDFLEGKHTLTKMIEMAKDLGAKEITIHFGTYPLSKSPQEAREEALKKVVRILTDSLNEIDRKEMCIGVENNTLCYEPNILGEQLSDFTYLFSQIDSSLIGLTLDVGHSHIMGDIETYLEHFKHRLIHTHIHDTDGKVDGHLPPGEGTIPWQKFFQSLKEINYNGPLVMEFPEATGQYQSFINMVRKK